MKNHSWRTQKIWFGRLSQRREVRRGYMEERPEPWSMCRCLPDKQISKGHSRPFCIYNVLPDLPFILFKINRLIPSAAGSSAGPQLFTFLRVASPPDSSNICSLKSIRGWLIGKGLLRHHLLSQCEKFGKSNTRLEALGLIIWDFFCLPCPILLFYLSAPRVAQSKSLAC
jgi:hypothetical protein